MSSKIDRRLLDTNAAAMGGGVGLAVLESMFSLVQSQSVMNAAMVRDYQLSHPLVMESLAVALNEILYPYGDPCDDYDDGGVVVPLRRGRRGKKVRRAPGGRRRPPGPEEPLQPDEEMVLGGDLGYDDDDLDVPQSVKDGGIPARAFVQKKKVVPGGGGNRNGDGNNRPGGGSGDIDQLAALMGEFITELKDAKAGAHDGPERTTTTTTKTSEHVENAAQIEAFLTSFMEMIGNHLEDLSEVNKSAVRAPMLMVT